MENFENWTIIVDITIFEKGSLKVLLHFIEVLQSHGKDSSVHSGSFKNQKSAKIFVIIFGSQNANFDIQKINVRIFD